MLSVLGTKIKKKSNRYRLKLTVSLLALLGAIAIGFTLLIIQIQSGTSVYLAALSNWSHGVSESVRQAKKYVNSGDPRELQLTREKYQIPLGHLRGRLILERDKLDYQSAYRSFLQGGNPPDDIAKMIWLFRLFQNAPYFNDAITAWRSSDPWVIRLGDTIEKLPIALQTSPSEVEAVQIELDEITNRLAQPQSQFQVKMSLASRVITSLLSIASVIFFLLLGGIATLLLKKLTATIRVSEYKFRSTFENAAVGIAQLDANGRIIEANNALCSILKYNYTVLSQLRYNQLIHPDDSNIFNEERSLLDKGESERVTFKQRLHTIDKSVVWVQTTMSRFEWGNPSEVRYICIIEDVSEQHRLSNELSYQARHDNLTGLINRRAFDGYLSESLHKARSENFVHCLCFIDLDQFKVINDTLGHFAGDQLLLQVTQLFSRQLRKSDLLARLGGDEFGLILDCCDPEQAIKMAENLRDSLSQLPFSWDGRAFNIGCSIGITPIMATSGDEASILQAADSACHMAKEQGRNRVIMTYQDDVELAARRVQMEWIERIRRAIDTDKLYLDAQKIVPLSANKNTHIEVLVRMLGDNNEVIPPNAFLPAAERFNLVHLIDRWVIHKVCEHLQRHPLKLNNIDVCHINISGKSFDHEDFTHYTINTIKQYNIPASCLCFEITETAAVSNLTVVCEFMEKLKAMGSSFALDDFGAGLSSFAYLKQFPVKYLKIDGAFVRNMANDDTDKAMVNAISNIGKTLGKVIVAEFVEDKQALAYLEEMGVEFAQGYYLHKPERFDGLVSIIK